jgi:hypothetical protein
MAPHLVGLLAEWWDVEKVDMMVHKPAIINGKLTASVIN